MHLSDIEKKIIIEIFTNKGIIKIIFFKDSCIHFDEKTVNIEYQNIHILVTI